MLQNPRSLGKFTKKLVILVHLSPSFSGKIIALGLKLELNLDKTL
jgi:hypothetical protein